MFINEGPLKGTTIVKRVFDFLQEDSKKESAKYLKKFKKTAIFTESGWHDIALSKICTKGLCLEFGVFNGESINYFSKIIKDRIWYGFDSFEGLQEDWKGGWYSKGYFNLNGQLPIVNDNVRLIKGWFNNTLPIFLKENEEKISFINIDCDTYESTVEIFKYIKKDRLQKGCIVVFDEYFGYIGWKYGEFKAWQEYVHKNKIKYEYIAFGAKTAILKIL